MREIVVTLPTDRDYCGSLRLYGERRALLAGPFEVCARAGDAIAAANQNPRRDPLLPYGDTPLGLYQASLVREPARAVLVLEPRGGQAALADANGRFALLIEGGRRDAANRLRPTAGSLQLAPADLRALVRALGTHPKISCRCEEDKRDRRRRRTSDAGALAAGSPEIPHEIWTVLARRRVDAGLSAAAGWQFTAPPAFTVAKAAPVGDGGAGGGGGGDGGGYGDSPAPHPSPDGSQPDAQKLKALADAAFNAYPDYCNKSTAQVADSLGHPELNGKDANAQYKYLSENWDPVTADQAQRLANQGGLVIAGYPDTAKDAHGHTAVVVPGKGKVEPDGKFYPLVQGGGSDWPPDGGKSDGTYSAGKVWNTKVRSQVRYFVPRKKT